MNTYPRLTARAAVLFSVVALGALVAGCDSGMAANDKVQAGQTESPVGQNGGNGTGTGQTGGTGGGTGSTGESGTGTGQTAEENVAGDGKVDSAVFKTFQDSYPYLVYTPVNWKAEDKLPMLVLLHGCGMTPEDQMYSSLLNSLADRERFIVVYPDVSSIARLTVIGTCWRAGINEVTSITRGLGGDADAVAGITRLVLNDYGADPERVYLMGGSAGAFQTTATAGQYPELYAAIGVHSGGGYVMGFPCAVMPDQAVVPYAYLAAAAMGANARVIPFFSIGGTADPLGEQPGVGGCARLAFNQWMATNNIVATGSPSSVAYTADDSSTVSGQVPDGFAWTSYVWRDQNQCAYGERWVVDGMGHTWSGGSKDPKWAAFTDPHGPSAAEAAWRFFKQFTLSGGNTVCAR